MAIEVPAAAQVQVDLIGAKFDAAVAAARLNGELANKYFTNTSEETVAAAALVTLRAAVIAHAQEGVDLTAAAGFAE